MQQGHCFKTWANLSLVEMHVRTLFLTWRLLSVLRHQEDTNHPPFLSNRSPQHFLRLLIRQSWLIFGCHRAKLYPPEAGRKKWLISLLYRALSASTTAWPSALAKSPPTLVLTMSRTQFVKCCTVGCPISFASPWPPYCALQRTCYIRYSATSNATVISSFYVWSHRWRCCSAGCRPDRNMQYMA